MDKFSETYKLVIGNWCWVNSGKILKEYSPFGVFLKIVE